jgi:hypothetical protein
LFTLGCLETATIVLRDTTAEFWIFEGHLEVLTTTSPIFQTIPKPIVFAVLVGICALPLQTRGNLFVAHDLFSDNGDFLGGVVGEYSNSGVSLNPSLISGLDGVADIVISGNRLYVLSGIAGQEHVGAYTTSGQTINASLITGLNLAAAIVVSGNKIFVGTDASNGTVAEYTTSGALVNASLITGLQSNNGGVGDLAISGENLFVASGGTLPFQGSVTTVGEYALTGAPINPALINISGAFATALAVSGSNIFVRNSNNAEERGVDTIAKYTTSGELVNPMFITGLTSPYGIAISANDFFVAEVGLAGGEGRVGKYNLFGEPIDPALITGLDIPFIAVSEPTSSVPDPLSTLWLALPVLGMFAAAGAPGLKNSLCKA